MTQNEILDIVKEEIENQCNIEKTTISPNDNFASMGLDSLDMVELTMAIEDRLSISIDDSTIDEIVNVQQLVDLICKLLEI